MNKSGGKSTVWRCNRVVYCQMHTTSSVMVEAAQFASGHVKLPADLGQMCVLMLWLEMDEVG